MKNYTTFIVTLLITFLASANTSYQIGQKSVTYTDTSRNRPLVTEIWYPTEASPTTSTIPKNTRVPFVEIETIPDASIANGKFPLLMVSHGTGGNRFSLTWFVEKMVQEGYIVAAVDHYGNTSFNKIPREFVKWWERAIDIQFVLTALLKDAEIGPKIDESRIGGVGFSLGGYTNIALAGGYVDRDHNAVNTLELPPEFPKELADIDLAMDSLIVTSYNKYKDHVKDNRIKAFFVMAPAIGSGFHTKEQTKDITAPVFILAGKGDTNTPIEGNALNYHELIATSELHLFNEFVDHYVFLNEGTEFGKQILPNLTVDHASVSRKDIHDQTLDLALEFFGEHL